MFHVAHILLIREALTDSGFNRFTPTSAVASPLVLPATETLRVQLTTTSSSTPKRPHQAFLVLTDPSSGLEAPFPLRVAASGAASIDVTQRDLPIQLLHAQGPLTVRVVLGSFGQGEGLVADVFNVAVKVDASATQIKEKAMRYGHLEEIHHQFKTEAQSPPKVVSLLFSVLVWAAVPGLFGGVCPSSRHLNICSTATNHLKNHSGST